MSALQASNGELRRCSAGVAQAASRSGAGTEQLQASRRYCKKKTDSRIECWNDTWICAAGHGEGKSEYLERNMKEKEGDKMTISFLCGAGCEGTGQLGLPSGEDFKKDIVLAKDTSEFFNKLNISDRKFESRAIIDARCTSILYQTVVEHKEILSKFSDQRRKTVEDYISYREKSGVFFKEEDEKHKEEVKKQFKQLYKNLINEDDGSVTKNERDAFFKNITLCSFSDELFNYLRVPDKYKTEVGKVERLLYAAYISLIKSIYKTVRDKDFIGSYLLKENRSDSPRSFEECKKFRKQFNQDLETWVNEITKKNRFNSNLYYSVIEKIHEKNDVTIVTTNYTKFAEKMTDCKTAYLHGRLDLFEDVKTKQVAELSELDDSKEVLPFIFIPSGVKPVVSLYQIKQYALALKAFEKSDVLCILGYSINTDDEHIKNFIAERMNNGKKVVLFKYCGNLDLDFDLIKKDIYGLFENKNTQFLDIKFISDKQEVLKKFSSRCDTFENSLNSVITK